MPLQQEQILMYIQKQRQTQNISEWTKLWQSTVDNTFDPGSSTKRFNDIYVETFQGTAVLSDNLTITGSTGDVLTFNGSTWVASAPTGGGGGGNAGVPQTLTINGATLSISGGNSVTLPNAVDLDPYVRLDQSTIPTVDNHF